MLAPRKVLSILIGLIIVVASGMSFIGFFSGDKAGGC